MVVSHIPYTNRQEQCNNSMSGLQTRRSDVVCLDDKIQ